MLTILTETTQWWEPIVTPLLGVLGTALAGLLGALIFRATAWINKKIGNDEIATAINRVGEVVDATVKLINQKFVDQLKKDGKFNKEAQKKALQEAIKTAKAMITDEVADIIRDYFGDFETYLVAMIEKTIANLK